MAFALALLAGAEAGTRGLEQTGFIPPPASLDGMVMERLDNMAGHPMQDDVWLLGNSTLAEGIDEAEFSEAYGARCWKLPHGSATAMSSVGLAEFYLRHAATPRQLVLMATVDDFNVNGIRAERSQKYIDFAPNPVPLPKQHLRLLSNGTRLRQLFSSLAKSALRGRFELKPAVRLRDGVYSGKPIAENEAGNTGLFRDFTPDFSFLGRLAKLSAQHAMQPPTLILLPVTDQHIVFRERLAPGWTYHAFRVDLASACQDAGISFIDMGATRTDYENFRDTYHANDAGKALLTREAAQRLKDRPADVR